MGCGGDREKGPTKESQKWEYITLPDFKATSAWNTVAYAWLWILFISTLVIYAVDTFTAVNLLVLNKWSSQIDPYIPFEYSKWIFAGCIIFSWVLWGFEWFRAIRVIKRGGVAESYMDPLAAELQSMRKQGWNRFLVFAALTKSKKGADLIAFFAYFAFKGALRIILAEGPRQVINTLTLIAVIKADFAEKQQAGASGISLFWLNVQAMWNEQKLQAIIIMSMMYSLAIWLVTVICLATAAILYIIFLWHYIPSQDGGLAKYCRRKVDKRLEKIVETKVKAAIEEEERKRRKAEEKQYKAGLKAEKKGKPFDADAQPFARQPTLPKLDGDDDDPEPALTRQDTVNSVSTLPLYNSRPGTRNEHRPPLPGYPTDRPLPPMRSATMGSQWSNANYEPDAPLLANAAQNGEAGIISRPGTAFARQDSSASYGQPMPRTMTPAQRSYTPAGLPGQSFDAQRPRTPGMYPPGDRSYSPAPSMPAAASHRPYSPGPPPRAFTPEVRREGPRAFSPMLRTDFSQAGTGSQSAVEPSGNPWNGGTASRSASPYGGPYRPQRTNTGPASLRSANSSVDRTLPHTTRQRAQGSVSSNGSFSRPMVQQKPSQANFNRPFTPASTDVDSSVNANSYEMKSNPYITAKNDTKPAGGYVAFNRGATSSPAPPQPVRSNTATTDYFSAKPQSSAPPPQQQQQQPTRSNTATTDYFSAKPLPETRSTTTPPADNRQTFGYSELVTGYGSPATAAAPPAPPNASTQETWNSNANRF